MILPVPYYSQHADVEKSEWKSRACSVVCLKMITDFLGGRAPGIDDMIDAGVARGGYSASGWSQNTLIELAKTYGVRLQRKEYRTEEETATGKLSAHGAVLASLHARAIADFARSFAEKKPVLVSAVKNFKDADRFHMVVFTGMKMDGGTLAGFYYHDPDCASAEEGKNRFVSLETFKKTWRRMAMFPI